MTVRYFAGARAAAGLAEEQTEARTMAELVTALGTARGARLARTLTACSFLVDGVAARDLDAVLPEQATIDVLPPFAGG